MNKIYDDLRTAVDRHHEAGLCTARWRADVRTAINAVQRYDPGARDLAEIEEACKVFRASKVASAAARVAYSGRVQAAIRLLRGAPTERWPDGDVAWSVREVKR